MVKSQWKNFWEGRVKKQIKSKAKQMSLTIQKPSYDRDFFKWTHTQALLLKKGEFSKLDIEHLIEEIESLGKSDKRSLKSHLINLLMHLLKIQYQPEMKENTNSWDASVRNARLEITLLLEDSPSLKNELPKMIESAYKFARQKAADETNISLKTFPKECSWTIKEII